MEKPNFTILFIIYIIVATIGSYANLLTEGFGEDKILYYLSLGLFLVGFVFLFISKIKTDAGKSNDSLVYGLLSVVACVAAWILGT